MMEGQPEGSEGRATLRFVPIGRELIDPLDLDAVLSKAVNGTASADAIWDGEKVVAISSRKVTTEQAQAFGQRLVVGYAAILSALQEGRLDAFVHDGQRCFRIDRFYWWHDNGLSGTLHPGARVPPQLKGAQILIDRGQLGDWCDVANRAITAHFATSLDSSGKPSGAALLRQVRSVTTQQKRLAKFFAIADKQGLGSLVHERLFGQYLQWIDRESKTSIRPIEAVRLSAFKKWRKRWRDGERWA